MKDFIVLDEVGETDDVDFREMSLSPANGFIDELDVISDDDNVESLGDGNDAASRNVVSAGTPECGKTDFCRTRMTDSCLPEADVISDAGDEAFTLDDEAT